MEFKKRTKEFTRHENSAQQLNILLNIVTNIISEPENKKFQTLKINNNSVKTLLANLKSWDLLTEIGFETKVKDHEEILILKQQLNTVQICKLKDLKTILEVFYRPIEEKKRGVLSFKELEAMKKEKQEYVDLMLLQAEEDRVCKLEIEQRNIDRLRKIQKVKRDEEKARLEEIRQNLDEDRIWDYKLGIATGW